MKKVLFSVGIDKLESKFRRLSSPRFREYADFYDFEYHEITEYPPLDRKPHWIKVHYILQLMNQLNDRDFIAFLDADIAIFRGDIELTTSKSIGLAKDSSGVFNTGVIAVKVNDFSRQFFATVWNKTEDFEHNWQENLAVIKLLDNLSEAEMEKHIEILPNSLNVTLVRGEVPAYDRYITNPCKEPIRFRHFAGRQPWYRQYFALPIAWDGILDEFNLPLALQLPVRFITIVTNNEPLIRYHIEVFKQLPFNWHWHIFEGIPKLEQDDELSSKHQNELSNHGTSEYLDELALSYSENITIYREPKNSFSKSKFEMMCLAIKNMAEEELLKCLMWQIDANELWTVDQICTAWQMFLENPEKTAAFYKYWTFVGNDLVISNEDIQGGNYYLQGLRSWIFKPFYGLLDVEPPIVILPLEKDDIDIAAINPFTREETEKKGLIFQNFAVDNNTTVDTARSLGVKPLAQQDFNTGSWKFLEPEYIATKTALMKTTLGRLNLRDVNLIIFPDWSRSEEAVGLELQKVIKSLATHPDRAKMTLLIDNSNITAEDADLILSSVAINLLMEEDLEVDKGPSIVLVGELSQIQWSALIPQLQGRIKLDNENEEVMAKLELASIPTYDFSSLPETQFNSN